MNSFLVFFLSIRQKKVYIYTYTMHHVTYYTTIHHVPKCMSCHKAIVVRTGRAHCFYDMITYITYIYIHMYIYIIYIWYSPLWMILRSSYRKLTWVGFEPVTTEFGSDALTKWAIRQWVQLPLRASFVQLLQFHLLFSVRFHCFHFVSRHVYLIKVLYMYVYMYLCVCVCMYVGMNVCM